MRSALIAMIGVIALTGAAVPAAAQTQSDKADMRCILVLGLAARDPKNQQAASQGSFYFLGRLAGRGSDMAKMGAGMIAEARSITNPAMIQTELTRCGQELNTRSAQMRTALGQVQEASKAAAAAAQQPAAAQPPAK